MLNLARWFVRRYLNFLALSFALLISMVMVAIVSLVMTLSSMVGGARSMDLTFNIVESPADLGMRDGSAVYGTNSTQGISCSDASAAVGDGQWWIRCRFVAEGSDFGIDYLESHGLRWGLQASNVVIRPVGGAWLHYFVAALLTALMYWLWRAKDRGRLRRELDWVAKNKLASLLAVVLPAVVSLSLSTLVNVVAETSEARNDVMPTVAVPYLLPMFMAMVIIAPVVEELLHRGIVFDVIRARAGPAVAAVLGTALFVGMHFVGESGQLSVVRIVALTAFSLTIYAVRIRCNALVLCVLAHMLVNGIGFAALALAAAE